MAKNTIYRADKHEPTHALSEAAAHSLQGVAEEFKEICKPKNSKFKGGYSANTTMIFHSWFKDVHMCVGKKSVRHGGSATGQRFYH